jgi:hypothetical protein
LWFIYCVLLPSPSPFSYSYSYPLHFPSFFCAVIHCSPSQLLFLPLFIHCLTLSLPPLPIIPQLVNILPSLLHTHYPLTSLLYPLYTNPASENPDTSTLYYNKENTQTPTRVAKPSSLHACSPIHPTSHPPFSATLPIAQISLSSLININPHQIPLLIDIITKEFSILYVNNCSGIEPVNLLLLDYTYRPGTERAHQHS